MLTEVVGEGPSPSVVPAASVTLSVMPAASVTPSVVPAPTVTLRDSVVKSTLLLPDLDSPSLIAVGEALPEPDPLGVSPLASCPA